MKPGRELDALVAEKVMGWQADKTGGYYRLSKNHSWQAMPGFSTDIAAAWEVVEALQRRRHYVTVYAGTRMAMGHRCTVEAFELAPHQVSAWHAEGSTAPHAICLAALRAVGVEVPA